MEFLPGGDLYSLLQKMGSLDENTTKYYFLQILSALKYLHSSGIIHRDLKPDNILIAEDGKVKLTDFGLSYLGVRNRQNQDPSLVQAKSLVGTPDYVAPEIIMNSNHSYSVDYWSMGVILYECLIGEPPFHGEDEKQTYKNILSGKYIINEDDGLSPEAIDLIHKLLILNPEERLGSKNIDDIFNHPFFKGVDINGEPPFVPQLANEEDTEYFETRYTFNEKDEADIVADISDCLSPQPVPQFENHPVTLDAIHQQRSNSNETPTTIKNNFESVSVESLAQVTRMVAAKRRRSMSFALPSKQSIIDDEPNEELPKSPGLISFTSRGPKSIERLSNSSIVVGLSALIPENERTDSSSNPVAEHENIEPTPKLSKRFTCPPGGVPRTRVPLVVPAQYRNHIRSRKSETGLPTVPKVIPVNHLRNAQTLPFSLKPNS